MEHVLDKPPQVRGIPRSGKESKPHPIMMYCRRRLRIQPGELDVYRDIIYKLVLQGDTYSLI